MISRGTRVTGRRYSYLRNLERLFPTAISRASPYCIAAATSSQALQPTFFLFPFLIPFQIIYPLSRDSDPSITPISPTCRYQPRLTSHQPRISSETRTATHLPLRGVQPARFSSSMKASWWLV